MPAIYLIWCKWYSSTAECSVHNTETDMQDLGCKYRNMFWKKARNVVCNALEISTSMTTKDGQEESNKLRGCHP